ncbi:DUF2378 family protein [Myxococcus sp. Y35]|uniref:DUF2378 family protein n=1 Tax=Pseudomyxococcus flavus TaxID=3115648 RepID=UPI003CF35A95
MRPPRSVPLSQRLVYVQVVEGLLEHGLRGRVSPRLKHRLRQAGIDLDRPLLPAYPVPLWERCLAVIIEETFPGVPREEAFRQLAERHVEGYGRTMVGRAVYGVLRLLGPRRLVQRLPQTLRATDNYTEVELTELGPTSYAMKMNSRLDAPGYAETLFECFLRLGGANSPRVTRAGEDAESTTYLLTWNER